MVGEQSISIDAVKLAISRCRGTAVELERGAISRIEAEQLVQPAFDAVSLGISNGHRQLNLAEWPGKDIASSGSCLGGSLVALLVDLGFSLFGSGSNNFVGRCVGRVEFGPSAALGFSQFLDELEAERSPCSLITVNCGTQKGQSILLLLHQLAHYREGNRCRLVDGYNLCRGKLVCFLRGNILDDLSVASVYMNGHNAFDRLSTRRCVVFYGIIQVLLVLESLEAAAQKVKDGHEIFRFRGSHCKCRVAQRNRSRQAQTHRGRLSSSTGCRHGHGGGDVSFFGTGL
mmetsp:Transcript_11925/g.30248  ORF Transcript_11925/g.30248 Transcript_11925/m.30248 type:complete len:287 (+) Transcript_11925:1695-2555(+)